MKNRFETAADGTVRHYIADELRAVIAAPHLPEYRLDWPDAPAPEPVPEPAPAPAPAPEPVPEPAPAPAPAPEPVPDQPTQETQNAQETPPDAAPQ